MDSVEKLGPPSVKTDVSLYKIILSTFDSSPESNRVIRYLLTRILLAPQDLVTKFVPLDCKSPQVSWGCYSYEVAFSKIQQVKEVCQRRKMTINISLRRHTGIQR